MKRRLALFALLVLPLCGPLQPVHAQVNDEGLSRVVLHGETAGTARRLAAAEKLAGAGQMAEAIDEYHRILQEAGDDLVPAWSNDPGHLVQARWRCHLRLAALPADALRSYRERIDGQAQKWLEDGAASHDARLLRRIVEETFCSRHTPKALDLLGDLAFERGAFDEAERWWRMIAPPLDPKQPANRAGQGASELVCPDPQIEVARVRAKQLLVRLFRSERLGLDDSLKTFRNRHGDAAGKFAARSGKYADILESLAGRQESLTAVADDKNWTTYAGDPSRNLVLPGRGNDPNRLNRLCQEGPRWRFHLERRALLPANQPARATPAGRVLPYSAEARSLAFFPVITGEQVLIADARYLTAYNLRQGEVETWFDAAAHLPGFEADLSLPARADLRYSLTLADHCVLARFGVQEVGQFRREDAGSTSLICCLNLEPDEKERRLRWVAKAPVLADGPVFFEGAPVVRDGRAYVAATHFPGSQANTAIYCYRVDASQEAPPLWKQEVCAAPPMTLRGGRTRHHLLALAGPNVVYCSHSGAIVAVDAATGRRAWAVRYPSRSIRAPGEALPVNDLAPPVASEGRLFVAPADNPRLFCLDPITGQLLWQRDELEISHLLGVAKGRLIFATTKGIRAVNTADGGDQGGWYQRGSEFLQLCPFGRGLLAGDLVLWPNEHSLCVLSQEDGEQPSGLDPSPLNRFRRGELGSDILGNLAYANGCFVVAGSEQLSIYVAPALLLQEREEDVRQHPQSAVAHFRLALALLDAGRGTEAIQSLVEAHGRTDEQTIWQGMPLRTAIRKVGDDGLAPVAEWTWKNTRRLARTLVVLRGGVGGHMKEKSGEGAYQGGLRSADMPLVPSLYRAWEARGDTGGHFLWPKGDYGPIRPDPPLYCAHGQHLTCWDPALGVRLWSREFTWRVAWLGLHRDTLIAAGTKGVCGLRQEDGQPLWHFRSPSEEATALSAFRLAGGRLFFLQGCRRLLALDAEHGAVLWQRWVPSAGVPHDLPVGRFLGSFHADSESVLIQSTTGKTLLIAASSGHVLQALSNFYQPWPRPPLAAGNHHLYLVPDNRRVAGMDISSGRERWTYVRSGASTPSGEASQLVGDAKTLFVVTARNFGYTLQRLDPDSGKAIWPEERLLGTQPVDAQHLAFDGSGVYSWDRDVDGCALRCRSVASGELKWEQRLSSSGLPWRVEVTPDYIVAHPAVVRAGRFPFRLPFAPLRWDVTVPVQEYRGAGFPVLLCDKKTGELVQRMNLVDADGSAQIQLDKQQARPVVRRTPDGLVVMLENRAWGFRARP